MTYPRPRILWAVSETAVSRATLSIMAVLLTLSPSSLARAQSGTEGMSPPQSVAPPDSGDGSAATTPDPSVENERERARGHFKRGVQLFQEGAYRAALVEFERAHHIAPNYRLLYNIGQTRLLLHDYLAAMQALQQYLVDGAGSLSPERISGVEGKLRTLSERVGRIAVQVSRAGARIFVDDREVGTSPLDTTIAVNVGRHRVLARAEDGASSARTVDVAGGDLLELQLKIAPPRPATAAQRPDSVPAERSSSARVIAITGMVLAGSAALAAGATGYLTHQASQDLDGSLRTVPGDPAAIEKQRDEARLLAQVTDLLSGGALLLTGASGLLWWLQSGDEDTPGPQNARKIDLSLSPAGLQIRGSF